MPEGYETQNRERDTDGPRDVRRLDDQRTTAGRSAAEESQRHAASRDEATRSVLAQSFESAGQVRHAVSEAVDAATKLAYAITEVQHMMRRSALDAMFTAQQQWWQQFTSMQR